MSENREIPTASAAPPSRFAQLVQDLRGSLAGRHRDYTKGSISRAILLLAVPMVLEMVMQSVFAVVDVYFVGKLGPDPVTVIGLTDSLLTLVFAVALGLSMATTATVARRIGEGKPEAASRAAGQSLLLGVVVAVVTGVPTIWFAADLLGLMGASDEVIAVGSNFTAIMLGGNITVVLLFLINAIFRGAGDAAIAMRSLWLANIINIILDPILIFGWWIFPQLGLEGAAVATTLGRAIGVIYQFYRLLGPKGVIRVRLSHLVPDIGLMRRLLRIASPGMLQFLIGTGSWLGVIRIVSLFGGQAVAGYTIAVRLIIFILLPAWGMGNAAATLVGQNLGAGQPDRAEKSVWLTCIANMFFMAIVTVIFLIFGDDLVQFFTQDQAVAQMAADCLSIVSYSYVFLAVGMITVQAFNGAGDTMTPTWINLGCYWMLQIPLALVLSRTLEWGPNGVFAAITITQFALAVVGFLAFKRGTWKTRQV